LKEKISNNTPHITVNGSFATVRYVPIVLEYLAISCLIYNHYGL